MDHKFKVGDRVACAIDYPDGNIDLVVGCEGTIVGEPFDYCGECWYPVDWDNEFDDGHSCNGNARSGHGWNVSENSIELANQSELQPVETPIELLFG